MTAEDSSREQADRAAAQAGRIGGAPTPPGDVDEAQRPLAEGGQGEAEGFELAEEDFIENASHGDQHAARRSIEDAPDEADDARAADAGEADHERSSERDDRA